MNEETEDDLRAVPRGRVRRAPRYVSFIVTGVAVAVLASLVIVLTLPLNPEYSATATFGYVATVLGLVGGLLGGAVAVLLDRRS